jgi:hypothetical protein
MQRESMQRESMTIWPVCMLLHPRPIYMVERAELFESVIGALSSDSTALVYLIWETLRSHI